MWNLIDGAKETYHGRQHLVECLDENSRTDQPLAVAVDMSTWYPPAAAPALLTAGVPRLLAGENVHHTHDAQATKAVINTVFGRLRALIQNGMRPICVFDGKAPLPKKNESNRQRNSKFIGLCNRGKEIARHFGCRIVQAPGEAECTCAALTRTGHADAVITSDSDSFAYGAQTVLKQHGNLDPDITFERYTISAIGKQCAWLAGDDSQSCFVLAAVICGCDFYEGVPGCGGKALEHFCQGLAQWGCSVTQLMQLLRQGRGLQQLIGSLELLCAPATATAL